MSNICLLFGSIYFECAVDHGNDSEAARLVVRFIITEQAMDTMQFPRVALGEAQ